MNASTLRNRKSRNSVPYEEIVSKLSATELGIVFKGTKGDGADSNDKDNQIISAYEQQVAEIVNRIKHGPFSSGLKIQVIDSLLEIVEKELDELPEQSRPNQEKNEENRDQENAIQNKP